MATNFNVSALSEYVKGDPQGVLTYVILGGKGLKDYATVQEGIKRVGLVPRISSATVDVSNGSISGYNNGAGSTTLQDINVYNAQLSIFETYSKEQLNGYLAAYAATQGSDPGELIYEEQIMALKMKELRKQNENYLWQDASAMIPDGGILKQLTDASTYVQSDFPDTSFQSVPDASILQFVGGMVKAQETNLPEYVMEPTTLAMSPANFAAYSRALYNLNGTVTKDTVGANGDPIETVMVPGTNITAASMLGLNGSNELVLFHRNDIIEVVDLVSESDFIEFIYNPFARWHELAGQYKLGVKVVDATKIVKTI